MRKPNEGATVLVADAKQAPALAAALAGRTPPASCYRSVGELVTHQPLSSIAVLVLRWGTAPTGTLLATLGRMKVEYPGMQKVAVLDEAPPLPIAEYLTSCGVSLLWNSNPEEGAEKLASVVHQLHERTRWIAS